MFELVNSGVTILYISNYTTETFPLKYWTKKGFNESNNSKNMI